MDFYLIIIILLLLIILLILLINYYFNINRRNIKGQDADIEFKQLRYLNEQELDKHFTQRGGDNTTLNIKNTFSIENEATVDIDNLPFKVTSVDSKIISAEKTVKKSPISKFLYVINKLKRDNDGDIILFDNNVLKEKLKKFKKLQTDADEFDYIQIPIEQIKKQREQLRTKSSPVRMIAGKLNDNMSSSYCFIQNTYFEVEHSKEGNSHLFLRTLEKENLILKVVLMKKFITEEGSAFFDAHNEGRTPLNIFGDVSIKESLTEKEAVKTIIFMPTIIY